MKEIKIIISKAASIHGSCNYSAEIFIDGKWYKELGNFSDPALALEEIAKNDDLRKFMRPKQNTSPID